MADDRGTAARSLRRRVRDHLSGIDASLEVLAEGMLAEASTIDLVARDDRGRVVLLMIGDAHASPALLTRALAHAAWVRPRIRDWLQLAPHLDLDPSAEPRAILVCTDFAPEARSAAAALEPGRVELFQLRAPGPIARDGSSPASIDRESTLPERVEAPQQRAVAAFRSGLRDEDLNLSAAERREFE